MGFVLPPPAPTAVTRSRSSRPPRLATAAALVLGIVSLPVQAQVKLVEPQTPLLPQHFAGWDPSPSGAPPLDPLSDSTTKAVVEEDGLTRTADLNYAHPGRPGILTVHALQFGDATGAVAAFTYLRSREMVEAATQTGAHNNRNIATGGTRTLLREGSSVVETQGASLAPDDLRALADTLPKIGGPKGLPPLLPTYLPTEALVPGSVEYAVGPAAYGARGGVLPPELIGFDKAGEAAAADYTGRNGAGKLTLLLLPTPQIAGDRGRAIESWLNHPPAGTTLGSVKLRRIGPMIALATGTGLTPDQAKAMVDSIHLRTELTWNKSVPLEFHAEVRKTASLLTSIVVFCAVFGLAAILLGVFLGFGRAWVRVLMGKPAATEPEFLRLDLRSGPNPASNPTES